MSDAFLAIAGAAFTVAIVAIVMAVVDAVTRRGAYSGTLRWDASAGRWRPASDREIARRQ